MTYDAVICNPVLHPDIILYPKDGATITYGRVLPVHHREMRIGAGGYTAIAMARLGMKCCCIDKIGLDIFGQYTVAEMQQHGLDMQHVTTYSGDHMFCVIFVQNGEGGTMACSYPPEFSETTFREVAEMIANAPPARLMYIYSWFWSFFQPSMAGEPTHEILRDTQRRGETLMMDVNYKPKEAPPSHEINELKRALPFVDVLLPNLRDAEILVGARTPRDSVKALLDLGVKAVALKAGGEGCYVGSSDGIARIPGPVVRVLDTTGAGDIFGGGFAYGWLQGWDMERAARFANAVAAYSISHQKSEKYPTIAQVQESTGHAVDPMA